MIHAHDNGGTDDNHCRAAMGNQLDQISARLSRCALSRRVRSEDGHGRTYLRDVARRLGTGDVMAASFAIFAQLKPSRDYVERTA